jgi:hypothetical protein
MVSAQPQQRRPQTHTHRSGQRRNWGPWPHNSAVVEQTLSQPQIARWISNLRFDVFAAEAGGDLQRAGALYAWNSQLAGALLEIFGHVEVLVRNTIHSQMSSVRPPNALSSWLLDRDTLGPRELERVEDVIGRIKRSRMQPTEDRVIAGLSMGFWTAMIGRRYEQLWRDTLRHAFPHGDGTRHQIAGYLNRVVILRNRVAHHESLITYPVAERHEDALELAATVDPLAERWVRALSRVPAVLAARP